MKQLKIGVDVDDVLLSCVPYALERENKKHSPKDAVKIEEITAWGVMGKRSDCIFNQFNKADFFQTQPTLPGAEEFLLNLMSFGEVFIITAVEPEYMGYRINRLLELFPFFPKENIIMGKNKSLFHIDILIDDGAHNICDSIAEYPILLRKPWNRHMTGLLSCNCYEECIQYIKTITKPKENPYLDKSSILCLIGPSGSHKNDLAIGLKEKYEYSILKRYTTNPEKQNGNQDLYEVVDKKTFYKKATFEKTCYGKWDYGIDSSQVLDTLTNSKGPLVAVVDICGAISLRSKLPFMNVVFVYCKEKKEHIYASILTKSCSEEEKINRLLAYDSEKRNELLCDVSVITTEVSEAVDEIHKLFQ